MSRRIIAQRQYDQKSQPDQSNTCGTLDDAGTETQMHEIESDKQRLARRDEQRGCQAPMQKVSRKS